MTDDWRKIDEMRHASLATAPPARRSLYWMRPFDKPLDAPSDA
jgi:hypothetical protein